MQSVMKVTGISTFDTVIPYEIGGMNAFSALLAAHRFNKSTLDTDLVARAYPKVWQTVRCLNNVPITPAAVADGAGRQQVSRIYSTNLTTLTKITRCSKTLTTILKPKISCERLAQCLVLSLACALTPSTASKRKPYHATASLMVSALASSFRSILTMTSSMENRPLNRHLPSSKSRPYTPTSRIRTRHPPLHRQDNLRHTPRRLRLHPRQRRPLPPHRHSSSLYLNLNIPPRRLRKREPLRHPPRTQK